MESIGTLLPDLYPPILHVLWLYWLLATGAAMVALLPPGWLDDLRNAVTLSACRGKLWESRPPAKLGPLTDWAVPQQWFAHFYALGVVANTTMLWLLFTHHSDAPLSSLLTASLLQLHLCRRLLETLFVMCYPPHARMHGIAYLFGMSYYGVLALSVQPPSMQRAVLCHVMQPVQPAPCPATPLAMHPLQWLQWLQWLGVGVFLAGNLLQCHAHWVLGALQRALQQQGSKGGSYAIPYGGAFTWVSCPHYLGEVVIYAGLVLGFGHTQPLLWVVLTWVVVNLVLAAGRTHATYRRTFKAYPPRRMALVPFIW